MSLKLNDLVVLVFVLGLRPVLGPELMLTVSQSGVTGIDLKSMSNSCKKSSSGRPEGVAIAPQ